MNNLANLLALRVLLDDPNAWLQGRMAADDLGSTVDSTSGEACCWCLLGGASRIESAAHKTARAFHIEPMDTALVAELRDTLKLYRNNDFRSVSGWNDAPGRTHAEILALIDATIMRVSRFNGDLQWCFARLLNKEPPCLEF